MLKPILGLAAVGLLGFLLLPLLGIAFFFMKVALAIGLVWLVFRLFRKRSGDEAHAD